MEHRAKDGLLWIATAGVHTPEDIGRLAHEALAEVKRLGLLRILVDDRKMTPDFRTLEVYQLPRQLQEWGAPEGLRTAVVYSGDSPKKEDFRFFEVVSGNFGGVEVRVFDDSLERALEWLKGGRRG
jgi:hypothetical protein